ncbi:hypothetical protein HJC23_007643 [Cyclotella cryptica]|uniref:Uncharacterized protein n=1 Tax=Cyclotella cryptica TaxID=29204 RepID=A0ABD3P6M4_9STRA
MAALYEHAPVGPHVHMGTLRTLVEEEDTLVCREDFEEESEMEMRIKRDVVMTAAGEEKATGRQIQLSLSILPGKSVRIMVDFNDVLIPYDGHGVAVKKFLVEADEYVGRVDFAVEL